MTMFDMYFKYVLPIQILVVMLLGWAIIEGVSWLIRLITGSL